MEFDSIEDIMDMRDIFLLMASHQPIKVNNSHEWIHMVTKTEKLQIFFTTTQANKEIFKSNYTRALRSFQLSSSDLSQPEQIGNSKHTSYAKD
jgi:hypothetical protein